MKKIVAISLFTLSSSLFTLCSAQYVRPGEDTSRGYNAPAPMQNKGFGDNFSIGGSFALQFGDITFVELEPLLSYHISNSFMVGVGPIYQYENVNPVVYGYGYTSSLYGGRVAAMFFLPDEFNKIFLMGEYDVLNIPEFNVFTSQLDRGYIALPMVGIGYKEKISDKFFFCIYGLWNFNNSEYNPFSNPVINAGFDVGLWR